MKIVFMSNSSFGNQAMRRLNECEDLVCVVTGVDKKRGRGKKVKANEVKEEALKLGLNIYQTMDINSEESMEYLKSLEADLFVVVAFGQLLTRKVLDIPKYYSVNIHASILPELRGAAPIQRAIMQGDKESGVSIMKMEEGLDTGDVALIKKTEINDRNFEELEEDLSKIGSDLIIEFIKDLKEDKIEFQKQDDSKSSYAKKIFKEDGFIDFEKQSAEEIQRILRSMPKRYAISTTLDGTRFKITDISIDKEKTDAANGEVVSSNKELKIATLDGHINVKRIQFPGKKEMDIKSFLLGNKIEKGTILGK